MQSPMPPKTSRNPFASKTRENESNFASYDRSCEIHPRFSAESVPWSRPSRMRHSLSYRSASFSLILLLWFGASSLAGQSTTAPAVTLPGPQNPFLGSAAEGKVTAEVLQIDFKEAIDRGLRNNLGL